MPAFHLDIYNMYGSIRAVLNYLDRFDTEAAQVARERCGCLTPGSAIQPRMNALRYHGLRKV